VICLLDCWLEVSKHPGSLNTGHSTKVFFVYLYLEPNVVIFPNFQVLAMHASHADLTLTFRHRASCIQDRRFATLQRTLFIYLINKYISLS